MNKPKVLNMLQAAGVTLFAAILFVPAANAQNPNPRLTISGGGSFLRGDRSFAAEGNDFRSEFLDGGKVRARLTLDLTKHWSLEGDYTFGRNNLRIQEQSGTTTEQRDFGIRLGQVHLSFLRFFTSRETPVRPYLTSGVGMVRYTPTSEAKARAQNDGFTNEPTQIESTTAVSLALGGGLEGRFSRWFGVRLDVKDYITAVPRFGVQQTSSGTGGAFYPVEGVVHNIEAGLGIVFFFLP